MLSEQHAMLRERDSVLTFDSALGKILNHTKRLPVVKLRVAESLGYVLASQVKSREPVPLFTSSSVDGFAVRIEDIQRATKERPVRLTPQETISAGKVPQKSLKPGHTAKIMTGAPVPKNTSAVVMKELVTVNGGVVVFRSRAVEGENIRTRGGEFETGNLVFLPGTRITPPVLGMLVTLGISSVLVYRKPRIALVITGNELRPPSAKLRPGQIRDSNSFSLSASLQWLDIPPSMVVRARDNEKATTAAFARALSKADVIISSGGVSVGDFDFVRHALAGLGVKTLFWRVAMKPGKPNFFGAKGNKLVFGLPGNPVSALVSFEMLLKPALDKMRGIRPSAYPENTALLESDMRKSAGRVEFVRAFASRGAGGSLSVRPSRGQGSHMVGGLAEANCLIIFPKELSILEKGDTVSIRFLSWTQM